MSITETIEKRQLIVDLGGEEAAPTAWRFSVVKFVRREDGSDVVPPARMTIDCTPEEAAAYLSEAVVAQRASLGAEIAARAAERDAHAEALADAEAKIADLGAELRAANKMLARFVKPEPAQ